MEIDDDGFVGVEYRSDCGFVQFHQIIVQPLLIRNLPYCLKCRIFLEQFKESKIQRKAENYYYNPDTFLAELLLWYLTGNILGVEVSCGRRADNVQTTCGQHESEISSEIWLIDDICHLERHLEHHPECHLQVGMSSAHHLQVSMSSRMSSAGRYIICMSSAGVYIICKLSAGTYVIHTSSTELLMVSVDLNYLSTLTGTGY